MNTRCPHCRSALEVDRAQAGQQAQCPSCQQMFTIPTPRSRAGSGAGASVPVVWLLLIFIGSGLMITAFCVPWWRIKITPPGALSRSTWDGRDDTKDEIKDVLMAVLPNMEFYLDHVFTDLVEYVLDRDIDDIEDLIEPRRRSYRSSSGSDRSSVEPFSTMLFGWNFTCGILILMFGAFTGMLALFLSVTSRFRKWGWTLMLPAAGLSMAALAMAVSFWLSTPGGDSENILSQGVIAGPFVAMAGGAVALLGSLFGGLGSIREFSRGLK